MDWYCSLSGRTIKFKSKRKHPKILTHNEFKRCIRIKHTIEKFFFFDFVSIFVEHITIHIRKSKKCRVKYDFENRFNNEITPYVKS